MNHETYAELSQNTISVMRNHKDTVFRLLFNDKKALLSLYNALNGTDYTDENLLQIETLEHAIYMGVKDDVAFILDSRLHIFEQQASFNPNMPLRDLLNKCRTLNEYCIFVQTIRTYSKLYPIEEAVNLAINECIQNDILRDFLLSQKAKVIQMAIYEFDVEVEIKKLRESEFKYGVDVGLEKGLEKGRTEGHILGIISTCQDLGLTREQTLLQLIKSANLTQEQAQIHLDKHWKLEK